MEFGLEEYAMATTEMIIRKIKTEADFEDAGKVLKKENLYESFTKVQKALPYYHGKRVLRKNGVLAVLLSFIYSGKIVWLPSPVGFHYHRPLSCVLRELQGNQRPLRAGEPGACKSCKLQKLVPHHQLSQHGKPGLLGFCRK